MALVQARDLDRLVDTLCASGRSAEAHHRVSLLLLLPGAAAFPLPRARFDGLLRRLLRARTPLLTLRLLQHAAPAPSLPNYNRLLGLLCRTSDRRPVLLAHRLLLRMRARPDAASYAALLDGYARAADPRAARNLLDEMPRRGLLPNSLARTFLVKALLRSRDVDAAMDLVDNHLWPCNLDADEHREHQDVTNAAAFANLVQCLCDEGFFHVVFRIAEEMPQRRRQVDDEFAYAQMIDSLCRTGQHHGASRIVYIMRKRGVCPSTVSYNCIVHGLCTGQKPGGRLRAHQLVMEGASIGYRPREVTYKVLVDELCRENELAKAKDVLELMLRPNDKQIGGVDEETRTTRIYNMFLSALRVVDNPSEQLAALMSMLQAGCKPDVITMNTVIHGFSKAGRPHEARRILDDMLSGKFCAPDVVTFTTLISGYLKAGDHAEALDVLRTLMPRRRLSPTVVTYNSVLKGLFGLRQVDTAMQVLEEMKANNNVAADPVTHTVVIKGLCDAGRLEEAKTFWDDTVWPSGVHDDYVYSAILGGLCKQSKLEQACDFLYELVDCGVSPGLVCYNVLIDTACSEGSKKLAYQLVKEMRRNGQTPDAVTWRILGKLHHCDKDESEERHRLVPSSYHVARSSGDDATIEPLASTEREMPLFCLSKHQYEQLNENRSKVKMMKGDIFAEVEIGYSTEATTDERRPDKNEPAKEPEDRMMANSISMCGTTGGVTHQEDSFTKPCKQPLPQQPLLSDVARKVFGLL